MWMKFPLMVSNGVLVIWCNSEYLAPIFIQDGEDTKDSKEIDLTDK